MSFNRIDAALVAFLGIAIGLAGTRLIFAQAATKPATQPSTEPAGLPGPVAGAAKKQVLSQVINLAKLETRSSGVGSRRDLFDGPTITLNNMEGHISTLNPGEQSHPPHQHVNEEMVIVVEGTLEVYINGDVTKAEKGAVMFFSSLDWHNVKNVGTAPAMYYVLNWGSPPRAGMTSTAPASAPARKTP